MANEIYSKSWWGSGVCNNTVGWGIVYKPYAGCESQLTVDFIARVIADGGIVESAQCIDANIT
jgi:hypothetical protein|tara:strand:- start:1148 stop:1336 length:189 start_codon:yes stop_codon:yes gene_type:complete